MIVVKVGGSEGIDLDAVCRDVAELHRSGQPIVLVHGGSHETNVVAEKLGHPAVFVTSVSGYVSRYTDRETLAIFEMVYCGKINKAIVEKLQQFGANAVGLSGVDGRLLEGKRKATIKIIENGVKRVLRDDYTGKVEKANVGLLRLLLDNGYLPVLTPPAISEEGEAINVDGDRAAAVIAAALQAEQLIILSNVPGLLKKFPDESTLIPLIKREEIAEYMEFAEGRMKKKVMGAAEAVAEGIGQVIFADARVESPGSQGDVRVWDGHSLIEGGRMRTYRFFQVDVFTDRPFGGNPLAVFPEAEGLSDQEMQQIAKEMNLSETTFVLPPVDTRADFKVRIFTPGAEVPFAGHPVLGTHFVLAQLGRIALKAPVTRIHQELKVGILPVDLYISGGQVERVMMTQGKPQYLGTFTDLARLAPALNVPVEEIAAMKVTPTVVSTGLPCMMVPVKSLAAVQGAKPSVSGLIEIGEEAGTACFMIFTRETLYPNSTVHVRMFAPAFGILEDPTTGSANGALGAHLVHERLVTVGDGITHMVSEQGYEMDRPSTVYIDVEGDGGADSVVRVSGQVTPLIEGVLRLP